MDISQLRPFTGLHTSLISFSGYIFRISQWASSPTEFGAFSNLWIVTPEDRRLLFADPPDSERVVRIYHKFDQVAGAMISVVRPRPLHLELLMQADDRTTVQMHLQLRRTLVTRFLVAASRATPLRWKSSDLAISLVDRLISAFVAKGALATAGTTETGQSSFAVDSDDMLIVQSGHAELNGADLGELSPPGRTVAFGEFVTTPQPFVVVGRLHLAYPGPTS